MTRFFFLLLPFWGIFTQVNAQKYLVYSVTGEVSTINKRISIPMKVGMNLVASSKIIVKNGGQLIVLDEDNARLYTIKTDYSGPLKSILPQASGKQISSSYLNYLKQKISGKPNSIDDSRYKQTAGTSYRDSDSLYRVIQSMDSIIHH